MVTLADRAFGGVSRGLTAAYVPAQFAGAVAGVMLATLMFALPAVAWASTERFDRGLWLGEAVATFGLVLVVFGIVLSRRAQLAPFAVGAYIFAAIFFTSTTSFANPVVTVARMFSDTFAGIAPSSVLPFLATLGASCGALNGSGQSAAFDSLNATSISPLRTSVQGAAAPCGRTTFRRIL